MNRPGTVHQSIRLIIAIIIGMFCGFLMGISFLKLRTTQFETSASIYMENMPAKCPTQALPNSSWTTADTGISSLKLKNSSKVYVPTNPKGAEVLPPGIVNSESDFYLRRLWGKPSEDLPFKQKYLVTFTVGVGQKRNIDAAVKKFSGNFTILLFHYDGQTNEWDEFEWSKQAIHVSVRKQAKWWYVKRFLHPDIVAAYDYIFIWDEDLGVEHFNAEEYAPWFVQTAHAKPPIRFYIKYDCRYLKMVKKHGLEISQPGLETKGHVSWKLTMRNPDGEVHKETEERPGICSNPHLPPCAGFVEIMAPVFSRKAWRCVWYMIQSDLVHGWGLDLAARRCVEPAHEKIGVVDSQWVIHQTFPTLGDQGKAEDGKKPWQGVRHRCKYEWEIFRRRMRSAETKYYKENGLTPPNATYGR